ncbi:hypothetical protein [Nocardia sp. NPDC004860]|uniref:hypothetical protein n=1 Tax=Nocardia sp. NPDC004860 TaxID=3154557 RepID=UPI0033A9B672
MEGPSWAALLGVPGTMVAATSLVTLPFWTARRRHIREAEQLAKIVSATGPDCPRHLRTRLLQEAYWIASYSAVRFNRRAKGILVGALALGWLVMLPIYVAALATEGFGLGWPVLPLTFAVFLTTVGMSNAVLTLQSWLAARRRLYAKLGGRSDIPKVPLPYDWRMHYTSSLVDGWVRSIFGTSDPIPKNISPNDMEALGKAISDWEQSLSILRRPKGRPQRRGVR